MEIIICRNYDEVSKKAFQVIKEVVESKEQPVLGLATGSSPIGLYQEWIRDHKEQHASYQTLTTFNLDEYVGLPENHPESYRAFMFNNLFDHIDVKKEQVHLPNGNAADLEQECASYEAAMQQHQIDLQLLGVGRNGHIGFNEPGTPFDQTTHIISLDQKTIEDNARFFNGNLDLVPKQAITMGIASIMRSKKILLIACGASKADAIYELVHGSQRTACPVTVLQSHADVVVIVDEEAASRIKGA